MFTSSGMNPASPMAFLMSSETWHSRCAAFRAQCCSVTSPLRRKTRTRSRKPAATSRDVEASEDADAVGASLRRPVARCSAHPLRIRAHCRSAPLRA
ncbi:Os02g0304600 [Oryza sativa Japonica Group]|nr:Os02g0304600 [Oryza sativa Japonica Group]